VKNSDTHTSREHRVVACDLGGFCAGDEVLPSDLEQNPNDVEDDEDWRQWWHDNEIKSQHHSADCTPSEEFTGVGPDGAGPMAKGYRAVISHRGDKYSRVRSDLGRIGESLLPSGKYLRMRWMDLYIAAVMRTVPIWIRPIPMRNDIPWGQGSSLH